MPNQAKKCPGCGAEPVTWRTGNDDWQLFACETKVQRETGELVRSYACVSTELRAVKARSKSLLVALKALLHEFGGGGERRLSDAQVMGMAQAAIADAERNP